jgi:hypothetical protein
LEGFDLKLHPKEARPWVWLSYALPLGFVGVVWPAMVAAGGVAGWVSWWLGPWVVFHGWMSTLSLVQHTGPHIAWTEEVGLTVCLTVGLTVSFTGGCDRRVQICTSVAGSVDQEVIVGMWMILGL